MNSITQQKHYDGLSLASLILAATDIAVWAYNLVVIFRWR